jgi:hypothetical protein
MSGDATGSQAPPAGAAFSLGWLMAQMFGPLSQRPGSDTDTQAHLPTVFELDTEKYAGLTFLELEKLLASFGNPSDADLKKAWSTPGHVGFSDEVMILHLEILHQLADDPQQLSAYQLGLTLFDTCVPPTGTADATFVLQQFSRSRLATMQAWLAEASSVLLPQAGATVSRSLQNWQDWADINASQLNSGATATNDAVAEALGAQASAWHALLSGETNLNGELSADAWVQAGQSILRTIRLLTLTIVRRFWVALLVVAAATGGLLYLATANTSGTATVWTSLVTVAAAFGVTGAGLRATALKTAGGIEDDIKNAAELDARAWSVTWLPNLKQGPVQRYRLASRGVGAPQVKKGIPASPAGQKALPGH